MSDLDLALQQVRKDVPNCMAVGYVDMTTGILVGMKTIETLPEPVVNLIAAATADLFQGRTVSAIEQMFRRSHNKAEDGAHYFQDIIVFSVNRLHVFLRGKQNPNHVAVFVCRSAANLGMVMATARQSMAALEAAV